MMDFTSTWVLMQKYRQQIGAVVAGVLLFTAGWQLGRVTSPYYAAHPIIFQDAAGNPGATGSLTALQALQSEGQALTEPKTAVAGVSTTQGTYVASVNSDLYHHKDCPSVSRIKEENRVWFATAQDAEISGYSPSACAKEKGNQ